MMYSQIKNRPGDQIPMLSILYLTEEKLPSRTELLQDILPCSTTLFISLICIAPEWEPTELSDLQTRQTGLKPSLHSQATVSFFLYLIRMEFPTFMNMTHPAEKFFQ